MEKLLKIINDLIRSKFWGVLEVRFEDGKVVFVRKTEHPRPRRLYMRPPGVRRPVQSAFGGHAGQS